MILHEFPDLQWLKKQADTNFADRQGWQGSKLPDSGWPTVVLNVKTVNTYRDNIKGPLSLFTNLSGSSIVQTDRKSIQVNSRLFFLTNESQRYTLDITSGESTETLNIHFGKDCAQQTLASVLNSPEKILDNGPLLSTGTIEFYNKIFETSSALKDLMIRLSVCKEKLAEQELVYLILLELLKTNTHLREREARLPALRSVTRHEIIRRLHDSADFIYSHPDKDISLDDLADISCLSKFHFLRLFKSAFNKTPYQFVTEIKIKEAQGMLRSTTMEVKEIASKLGFKDSSTFSRLYFRQTGFYPTQVRR